MVQPPSVVSRIDAGRPEYLLDALSPRGKYFQRFTREEYLFRGQADASWPLVPSAFRPGAFMKTKHGWRARGEGWSNAYQITAELQTMEAFFRQADIAGLVLPEDSQITRHILTQEARFTEGEWDWPPLQLLSLIALAQHYGIATRLLDWTRNPYIAAYFAASGAIDHWPDVTRVTRDGREALPDGSAAEGQYLCVWAFSDLAVGADQVMMRKIPEQVQKHRSIELVTAPAASNPNLNAQQGVFTLSRPADIDLEAPVVAMPLDAEVGATMMSFANVAVLIQYRLLAKHSVRLLQLLAKEGITAATVYPGYYGVARALKERALWETLPL